MEVCWASNHNSCRINIYMVNKNTLRVLFCFETSYEININLQDFIQGVCFIIMLFKTPLIMSFLFNYFWYSFWIMTTKSFNMILIKKWWIDLLCSGHKSGLDLSSFSKLISDGSIVIAVFLKMHKFFG